MAEPTNKQQFQDLEYVFDRYYRENIAPVVKGQMDFLRKKQSEEYVRMLDNRPVAPGMSGMMHASMVAQEAHLVGEWNSKTSDDLLKMVDGKLGRNKNVQHDFAVMIDAWRLAAVKEMGEQRYAELSAKCPSKDLAREFVSNRFMQLELEQLAKAQVPKSSLEYILKKGFGESFPAFLSGLSLPEGQHDSHIRTLAEKMYDANAAEKAAAFATTFAADAAVTGGYGSWGKLGKWLGVDVLARGGLSLLENDTTFDQMLGKELYGDEEAFASMRSKGKKVKVAQSETVHAVNDYLKKPMTIPEYRPLYSPTWQKARYDELAKSAAGDAAIHMQNVLTVSKNYSLKPSAVSDVQGWLLQKSQKECIDLSSHFLSIALTMQRSKMKSQTVNGQKFTFDEVVQRAYDYARAADKLQKQQAKKVETPQFETVSVPQQSSSEQYQQQNALQQQYVQQQQYQSQQNPQMMQGPVYQQAGMQGWTGLMNQFGLGGMSDIGKNLGYVLAMLPDMLIGMLTGQSKNLHLKDNLLPFGAIFAGLFVKNPLLKMLLIGLGGANILNKAGHEILDNAGVSTQHRPKRYVQHADELLSERIEQPAMKGNALVATIDHKPCVIYIDEQSADAFYQGKLPLNVLCNAVLRKYDEQQAQVRHNYDRGIDQQEQQQLSRGIK
jgi:hypothetical protein